MTPYELFSYDLADYPFPSLVAHTIEENDLSRLDADLPPRTWQTDQQSPWHGLFYAGFNYWYDIFDEFVKSVVAPRLDEPCYYQRVPTFRVQLPGNTAVGAFHTDAEYNHPLGEVSFWLPLTEVATTSTVFIMDDDGSLVPVVARPGDVAQFSAVTRTHGNLVNMTGRSRVSFDFRLIPTRLLPESAGPPTKHTRLRFVPGEYYADEVIG